MIVTRRRRRRRRRRVQGEHRVKSQLASHPNTKQQPVSVGGTKEAEEEEEEEEEEEDG